MLKGIDVSRWQQSIMWPTVKGNVDFAIIKIGGSDDGLYMDGMAVRNVLEARSAGVQLGFFVYLGGAYPVAEEIQHIKNLISNIGGLRPGEVFALDWEEHHATNEVAYVHGIAKGLVDAGFPAPLIYMSLSRVRTADWKPLVDMNCGLWVAAWGNNDSIADTHPPSDEWPFWAFWQYSSTGNVPGISGKVDMNYFNGSLEDFKKYGSTRTVTLPSPVNVGKVVESQGTQEYTVRLDENLSVIAAARGLTWQQLWTMNRDRVAHPNRIFPGQKLRVPAVAPPAPVVPTSTHQPGQRIHVVENGENLSVIASRYGLPSWPIIWEANRRIIGDDPNYIKPGQRLVIP